MPRKKRVDISFDKHHRRPRSIGGKNNQRNISILPRVIHRAWHILFANHTAETICHIINERYLDPDYMFICVKRPPRY